MNAVSIIGAGRLGASLGYALLKKGFDVKVLCCRTFSSARESARIIGGGRASIKAAEAARESDVLLLSVPDDDVAKVAEDLAGSAGQDWIRKTVLHCSGRLPAAILDPLRQKGAAVGSFHPAQTFVRKEASLALFRNIYFGLEGQDRAVRTAGRIARRLGGHPLLLAAKDKPLYHAACVLCSNGVSSLLRTAASLIEKTAGEEKTLDILRPLAQKTLQNVKEVGFAQALSGPIIRGDVGTVLEHLKAVPDKGESLRLYKIIGLINLEIGAGTGTLSPEKIKALKTLLEG